MNDNEREKIALFRYGVIAPLVSGTLEEGVSKDAFFRDASNKIYQYYDETDITISEYTIERWFRAYENRGFDGLKPQRRNDSGVYRKIDEDIKEQIIHLKKEYPKIPATIVYSKLIANGTITKKDISLSTVTRFINTIKKEENKVKKERLRYEKEHINEMWHGDSSVGPYLTIEGKKYKTYMIVVIDDASRLIVGADIVLNDNFVNVMSVLKSAVSKYGKPTILRFDNGPSYKNKQMELLGARIGTTLSYCIPYEPEGKAKIERWFKTAKSSWSSCLNMFEIHSLEELRISLLRYVHSYNNMVHSSLKGLSPSERFFNDAKPIRRFNDEQIDEIFLLEIERKVSKDNVIAIDKVEYEVDYQYNNQKIKLRYAPDLSKIYVVDNDKLTPIKLLNKIDNSKIKRNKVQLGGAE